MSSSTASKKRSNNRRRSNAKTVLCKFFTKDGNCPYGEKCSYAHGEEQLVRRTVRYKAPCWYFNQGGCTKTAQECTYEHVIDKSLRKPLRLQHPCPFFHYRTPLQCRRGDNCDKDHSYELTANEWKHHFPSVEYPGDGYFQEYKSEHDRHLDEEFPILRTPKRDPKPIINNWSKQSFENEPVAKDKFWGETVGNGNANCETVWGTQWPS